MGRTITAPLNLSSALDLSQLQAAATLPRYPLHMGADSAPPPRISLNILENRKKFPIRESSSGSFSSQPSHIILSYFGPSTLAMSLDTIQQEYAEHKGPRVHSNRQFCTLIERHPLFRRIRAYSREFQFARISFSVVKDFIYFKMKLLITNRYGEIENNKQGKKK